MKVIIAGSRHFTDASLITAAVRDSGFEITEIIEGGQRTYDKKGNIIGGIDFFANRYARHRLLPFKTMKAEWNKYGKKAGPMRNREMARYADALILIWDGKSKGSANMKEEAEKRGLRIFELIVPS